VKPKKNRWPEGTKGSGKRQREKKRRDFGERMGEGEVRKKA